MDAAQILDSRRDAYLEALRGHQPSKALAEQHKASTTAELTAWSKAKRRGLWGAISRVWLGK